jgi:protein TonB
MTSKKNTSLSYSISVVIHSVAVLLLLGINLSFDYAPSEFVELTFGISDEYGSSGAQGNKIDRIEEISENSDDNKTENKNEEVTEVELPKSENVSDDNIIKPADVDKEVSETSSEISTETVTSNVSSTGQGNEAEGEGSFGFDIDWGGKGTRKIYSFILPQYPEGVKKEVNIKLQFTILPDGTVGTIIPKIKADTRLENAAINSLRQWRFEALNPDQKQLEQTAIIVFPYRLQ